MLVISTITISTMHGSMNTKFINAKQATEIHAYKNTKRKLYTYVNQRLQIWLELLMISGMPLETRSAFNERWNNKFYYKVASCWLFPLSQAKLIIKSTAHND